MSDDAPSTVAYAAVLGANAFYNLPTKLVWNIARDTVPNLNVARILACSEAMEQLLDLGDATAAAEEGFVSPTGIDCACNNLDTPTHRMYSSPGQTVTKPSPTKRKAPTWQNDVTPAKPKRARALVRTLPLRVLCSAYE